MRNVLLLAALALGFPSLQATAADTTPASSYSNLLPTERDLAKSTAAAEAKAKAEKEKAERTGMPPAVPKTRSAVTLTATCKDASGKSFTPKDPGYDSCMQLANMAAQRERDARKTSLGTGTGTDSSAGAGAGFQFKVGE